MIQVNLNNYLSDHLRDYILPVHILLGAEQM